MKRASSLLSFCFCHLVLILATNSPAQAQVTWVQSYALYGNPWCNGGEIGSVSFLQAQLATGQINGYLFALSGGEVPSTTYIALYAGPSYIQSSGSCGPFTSPLPNAFARTITPLYKTPQLNEGGLVGYSYTCTGPGEWPPNGTRFFQASSGSLPLCADEI